MKTHSLVILLLLGAVATACAGADADSMSGDGAGSGGSVGSGTYAGPALLCDGTECCGGICTESTGEARTSCFPDGGDTWRNELPAHCNGQVTLPPWFESAGCMVKSVNSQYVNVACPCIPHIELSLNPTSNCDFSRIQAPFQNCTAIPSCDHKRCHTDVQCNSGQVCSNGSCQERMSGTGGSNPNPGDSCSNCLDSCRGLSQCCSGTGCICDSACN